MTSFSPLTTPLLSIPISFSGKRGDNLSLPEVLWEKRRRYGVDVSLFSSVSDSLPSTGPGIPSLQPSSVVICFHPQGNECIPNVTMGSLSGWGRRWGRLLDLQVFNQFPYF